MPVTRSLLDLQTVDTAMDRLRARQTELTGGADHAAARAAADEAERALGEIRLSIDEVARDATKLEHEIDSLTQKTAAERGRMSDGSVANARELEAIGREIENLDRRRTDREDELLASMELREQLDRQATAAEREANDLRAAAAKVGEGAETELGQVVTDLDTRMAERAALLPAIDPEVLELYDELRATKRGVGAAALLDGVCQGCHETLSAVELDRVKRADGLIRCEHCRRILIL